MWGSVLISIQRGTPKVASVHAVHVSFQKQLTRLRKRNWKSAVILTPLCGQTHLRRHTHTLTTATKQYTHLSNTAKSWIIRRSNPSQISTLLSPLESEVWDCSEISCWSQGGCTSCLPFPLFPLSLSLFSKQQTALQTACWCLMPVHTRQVQDTVSNANPCGCTYLPPPQWAKPLHLP